jgi:lysozyme family protein
MAKLDELIPFFLFMEAGGAKSCKIYKTINGKEVYLRYDPTRIDCQQQYYECKTNGTVNDPDDTGGLTVCGVTYATYAAYCNKKNKVATIAGIKNLSYTDWYNIFKTMYWDKWKADEIENQAIANLLVDWAWLSGTTGIKRPQRILGVKVDGIVGAKTIAAVNSYDAAALFDSLHADRLKHFDEIVAKSASQAKFLKGWKRRVNAITIDGFKYV